MLVTPVAIASDFAAAMLTTAVEALNTSLASAVEVALAKFTTSAETAVEIAIDCAASALTIEEDNAEAIAAVSPEALATNSLDNPLVNTKSAEALATNSLDNPLVNTKSAETLLEFALEIAESTFACAAVICEPTADTKSEICFTFNCAIIFYIDIFWPKVIIDLLYYI